jgi:phenylalanyl-tRNA synthetase beta chain
MKISRSWLQDYVDLAGLSGEAIAQAITFLGFEVEGVVVTGAPALSNVVVGEVLTRDQHPNADRLSICTVAVGEAQGGTKRIVCGAQNYRVGDRVPVALIGAVLPGDFTIKASQIRGEASQGMMCSGKELGIGDDHAGLLILTERPEIGLPINDVLPPGDTVFDLEITPNRPDCLSHLGIARELAAWFKRPLRYPETELLSARKAARPDLLQCVRVDAPEDCPLYTATVVSDVKVAPSPAWMQRRLAAVGVRPINNLVDIGNYVMLELGQPLHAFDAAKLGGAAIVVRRAAAGEKLVTLDEKERALDERILVIADAAQPIVIAGIMGGEDSGVSAATMNVVLEGAYFRRQILRGTSKRIGLSSDSSYRYERGVDAHSLGDAVNRALNLLVEWAGGTVCGPTMRVGGDQPWQREILLTPDFVRERVGFDIPDEAMRDALTALELDLARVEENDAGRPQWTVTIPSWRDDLDRPIDLVEEVLRVYGTDKIPAATITAPGLLAEDDPVALFNRRVAALLTGQGFNECVTYTLRSAREIAPWVSATAAAELALANPFVEDQSHLRPTLLPGLLDALRLNQSRGNAAARFFETGRVFIERDGQNLECAAVAFVIAERDGQPAWLERAAPDFYTTKRLVEGVAAPAGIDLARQPLAQAGEESLGWQAGHHAFAGDIKWGWAARFGLLDLALGQSLGLEGKVYAGTFAILPEKLPEAGQRKRFQPFSLVPAALRDLALLVPSATAAADVQKAVAKHARAGVGKDFELEDVRLFDVYQGKGLPEGHKSLGFTLRYRAADRTLTDAEVNAAFTVTQTALEAAGYQIRK